jgi:hypothetical protein
MATTGHIIMAILGLIMAAIMGPVSHLGSGLVAAITTIITIKPGIRILPHFAPPVPGGNFVRGGDERIK